MSTTPNQDSPTSDISDGTTTAMEISGATPFEQFTDAND